MKKLLAAVLCMAIMLPVHASQEERQAQIVQQLLLRVIEQDNVEQLQRLLDKYPTLKPTLSIVFFRAVAGNKKKLIQYLIAQPTVDVNMRNQDERTPLMTASIQGNIPVARRLLQHNANSSLTDNDGYTALMIAAQNGHLYIVRILLKHNSSLPEAASILNKQDTEGRTALWLATDERYEKIARLLLAYGADPNIADRRGISPLHLAAMNDLVDTITLLLEAGALLEADEKETRQTPLIAAAEHGNLNAIKALVSKGASLNKKDVSSNTALLTASRNGNDEVVAFLLEQGADTTIKNNKGYTALMHAAENGHLYIVRMLLKDNSMLPAAKNILNTKNNKKRTALWLALDKKHEKIARLLLTYGADPNIADKRGISPLHLAAIYDLNDVIALLLNAGALLDAEENISQQTPLIAAAEQGNLKAVNALVSKGASLNKTDASGNTALLTASRNGYSDVVTFLLEQGADPNIINSNGATALIGATVGDHTEVVTIFLDKGYSVDSADSDGVTLLNIALAADKRKTAQLLLNRGASVDSRNEDGETPLILAAINGDGATVAMLLARGADPNATDNTGQNALQYALQNNYLITAKGLQRITQKKIPRPSKFTPQQKPQPTPTAMTIQQIPKDTTAALWDAISNGDPKEIRQLLREQFNATARDEQGNTLLMNAIKQAILEDAIRRMRVIELLLTHPALAATINTQNTAGETALMLGLDNPSIVQKLLEYKANPMLTDKRGNTIIIRATQKDGSNLTNILNLLKKHIHDDYPILLNKQNNDGMSALMYAIKKNDPKNVRLLLSHGAHINIMSNEEVTPLELAHHVLALTKGAEEPDKEEVARAEDMVQILQQAAQTEAPPPPLPEPRQKPIATDGDPLFEELKKGDRAKVETIEAILSSRPGDLTRQRAQGTTPLMVAIESNVSEKVLRNILDKVSQEHVNLKQTMRPYESALTKAINGARDNFIKLLIEKGASFTINDIGLAKVLAAQAKETKQKRREKRLKKIVRLLEEAKEQQKQGQILLLAAHGGDTAIVDSALNAGASINTQDQEGNTPLMRAILAHKDSTARHVIEKEARLNIKNKQGKTALLLAVEQNNYGLIDYLLRHDADTKIVDNAGNTALSLALDKGHFNVANRIRIHQALRHLQKTQNITHVLKRHSDPQGEKTTTIIGPEGQDVIENPYTGQLDGTTASFFPRSWNRDDIYTAIETILQNPTQLDERPADINADGEMVSEALIIQGAYKGISVKVIISEAPNVGWIVFTAYPNIPRP